MYKKLSHARAAEAVRIAKIQERESDEFKEREATRQRIYAEQAAVAAAYDREEAEKKQVAALAASASRLASNNDPDAPTLAIRTRIELLEAANRRLSDKLEELENQLATPTPDFLDISDAKPKKSGPR